MLAGERLSFVPGWDCHGLPIELKVLQTLPSDEARNLTALDLRSKAGAFAKETVERQSSSFQRYGVWAEWEAPYLTLKKEYEAAQIRVFLHGRAWTRVSGEEACALESLESHSAGRGRARVPRWAHQPLSVRGDACDDGAWGRAVGGPRRCIT